MQINSNMEDLIKECARKSAEKFLRELASTRHCLMCFDAGKLEFTTDDGEEGT